MTRATPATPRRQDREAARLDAARFFEREGRDADAGMAKARREALDAIAGRYAGDPAGAAAPVLETDETTMPSVLAERLKLLSPGELAGLLRRRVAG